MQKLMPQISARYFVKIFHESHTQKCYPRTYKAELAEDIFRIYDMDNNGSVDFQVASTRAKTSKLYLSEMCFAGVPGDRDNHQRGEQ